MAAIRYRSATTRLVFPLSFRLFSSSDNNAHLAFSYLFSEYIIYLIPSPQNKNISKFDTTVCNPELRNCLSNNLFWSHYTMDHFKGLFSRFEAQPRPVALENSPLNRRPNEVLLCIMDYLPASSATSFSLSCLQLQHRIGNRHIKNLSGSTEDTVKFLNLLERDLPDQIVCYACNKLHKINVVADTWKEVFDPGGANVQLACCATRIIWTDYTSMTTSVPLFSKW
jgi:hypothetical protein